MAPSTELILHDAVRNRTAAEMCEEAEIPAARELFTGSNLVPNIVICVISCLLFLATLGTYLELVVFIHRHFKVKDRQIRTTWVLAVYPIFSFCSMVAVLIPRSSTIVDLVMDVFLSSCLYQFLLLLVGYLGNEDIAWETVKDTDVRINTAPVCCCCLCLPTVKFTRKFLAVLKLMVIQVTIIRPILSFIAAVMWADGVYTPGHISADNGYIFITIINLVSSSTAMWGLTLMRTSFQPLLKPYQPTGKFMALQGVILLTIVPGLVINILVNQQVIPCVEILPSKARGDRIYHGFLLCAMLPLLLVARMFYRRKWEGGFGSKVMDTAHDCKHNSICNVKDSLHVCDKKCREAMDSQYECGARCSKCVHTDPCSLYRHNAHIHDTQTNSGPVMCKEYVVDNRVTWVTYL